MEIQEIEKSKMDALKSLSDTNLKVSEAKGLLLKLNEEETEYLCEREERALARIKRILDESKHILDEAEENYSKVNSLSKEVTDFAQFLTEAYDEFQKMRANFDVMTKQHNNSIAEQEEKLSKLKENIKTDSIIISKENESLKLKSKLLENDRKIIADQRGTIERTIKRLQEGKI